MSKDIYCAVCGIILIAGKDDIVHCERCGPVHLCGEDDSCVGGHLRDEHPEVLAFIKPGVWEEEVS